MTCENTADSGSRGAPPRGLTRGRSRLGSRGRVAARPRRI